MGAWATASERELTVDEQARLVRALGAAQVLGHAVERREIVETHISYVLLTGSYAYKIKKAVNLGFLDFSRLASRQFYCGEELRLNRRSAPQLYLGVIAIGGSAEAPRLDAPGPAIEYAVKMRQFPQAALASALLARGELSGAQFDRLAQDVAALHLRADVCAPHSPFGTPSHVLAPALRNFDEIAAVPVAEPERRALAGVRDWTRTTFAALESLFAARRREGYVRECHGDLHLGNIVRLDGRLTPFDCLEFEPEFRWIDVMSDLAFVCMDLDYRVHAGFAMRFANRYLEITGDYAGLRTLSFYRAYRAMVRAKVALLKLQQASRRHVADPLRAEAAAHIELARRYTLARKPALILTHGLSGSGKTTLTQSLLERIGAVRLRSDVERKRLHGLKPSERSRSDLAEGLYSERANQQTYARLLALAGMLLASGWRVIVDATFLRRSSREAFYALARERNAELAVLEFDAPLAELGSRIEQRERAGEDASEANLAVLERQIADREPLTQQERDRVILIASERAAEAGYLERVGDMLAMRLGLSSNGASG